MKIVQFIIPGDGKHLGVVQGDTVIDVTSGNSSIKSTYEAFFESKKSNISLEEFLESIVSQTDINHYNYWDLYQQKVNDKKPYLTVPFDHNDQRRIVISGTGLTHTGSMESRDSMHTSENQESEQQLSDSAIMFEMGLRGGKPDTGKRGVSPEWFYKGNGSSLKGSGDILKVPNFALDGGEEPEIAVCYINDHKGVPYRVGFTLGNEWSDHETEKINYLYLAPSKLRECSIGPELITDLEFEEVELSCDIERNGKKMYESGTIFSGEKYMSHSLNNCEDHHFKYPQHRIPGDLHIHFLGTSKLSFGERDWKFKDGDVISIRCANFTAPLVNSVSVDNIDVGNPIVVKKG